MGAKRARKQSVAVNVSAITKSRALDPLLAHFSDALGRTFSAYNGFLEEVEAQIPAAKGAGKVKLVHTRRRIISGREKLQAVVDAMSSLRKYGVTVLQQSRDQDVYLIRDKKSGMQVGALTIMPRHVEMGEHARNLRPKFAVNFVEPHAILAAAKADYEGGARLRDASEIPKRVVKLVDQRLESLPVPARVFKAYPRRFVHGVRIEVEWGSGLHINVNCPTLKEDEIMRLPEFMGYKGKVVAEPFSLRFTVPKDVLTVGEFKSKLADARLYFRQLMQRRARRSK